MLVHLMKISYIALNVLLLLVAGTRILLPFYLFYGNSIVRGINYDRHIEFTSFWMIVLVPWDIILAVSGILSILRNDREQIFENTFKLSVLGLVVIWIMEGIGDRFQIRAPYLLKTRMKKYAHSAKDKEVVDLIRTRFKCCGYTNLLPWNDETGLGTLPSSCCGLQDAVCTGTNAYKRSCKYVLGEYVDKLNLWLVLANFPFIELLVSLWNCFLTDILPTSTNVIYELGDTEDGVIRQRMHDQIYGRRASSTPSSPSPLPISLAAPADATKDGNMQSGVVLDCRE